MISSRVQKSQACHISPVIALEHFRATENKAFLSQLLNSWKYVTKVTMIQNKMDVVLGDLVDTIIDITCDHKPNDPHILRYLTELLEKYNSCLKMGDERLKVYPGVSTSYLQHHLSKLQASCVKTILKQRQYASPIRKKIGSIPTGGNSDHSTTITPLTSARGTLSSSRGLSSHGGGRKSQSGSVAELETLNVTKDTSSSTPSVLSGSLSNGYRSGLSSPVAAAVAAAAALVAAPRNASRSSSRTTSPSRHREKLSGRSGRTTPGSILTCIQTPHPLSPMSEASAYVTSETAEYATDVTTLNIASLMGSRSEIPSSPTCSVATACSTLPMRSYHLHMPPSPTYSTATSCPISTLPEGSNHVPHEGYSQTYPESTFLPLQVSCVRRSSLDSLAVQRISIATSSNASNGPMRDQTTEPDDHKSNIDSPVNRNDEDTSGRSRLAQEVQVVSLDDWYLPHAPNSESSSPQRRKSGTMIREFGSDGIIKETELDVPRKVINHNHSFRSLPLSVDEPDLLAEDVHKSLGEDSDKQSTSSRAFGFLYRVAELVAAAEYTNVPAARGYTSLTEKASSEFPIQNFDSIPTFDLSPHSKDDSDHEDTIYNFQDGLGTESSLPSLSGSFLESVSNELKRNEDNHTMDNGREADWDRASSSASSTRARRRTDRIRQILGLNEKRERSKSQSRLEGESQLHGETMNGAKIPKFSDRLLWAISHHALIDTVL